VPVIRKASPYHRCCGRATRARSPQINYLGADEGIKTLTTQSCWALDGGRQNPVIPPIVDTAASATIPATLRTATVMFQVTNLNAAY